MITINQTKRKGAFHLNPAFSFFMIIALAFMFTACKQGGTKGVMSQTYEGDGDNLEHVVQNLVAPPFLPEHEQVAKGGPKIVQVTLTVEEKKMEVAPGDSIWALTFNGTVPGPIIVAHEGDFIELTFKNPSTNTMMHNMDFHAATGHLGGGDISEVNPGEQVTFRFRATRAGVFVYHCAPGGMMIPMHVVSGMNGVIMILPREGLKDEKGNPVTYDRAYYVVEQDFYLPKDENGKFKNIETPQKSMQEMEAAIRTLIPTHIVFNGHRTSLLGKRAMEAKVGENVLFITSQANRDTRIHLIGGHADLFWPAGKFHNQPIVDLETWAIPGGSAAAAMYKFREPGTYLYLNHNLIEAIAFGAAAQVKVEGEWDNSLMKEIEKPGPIK